MYRLSNYSILSDVHLNGCYTILNCVTGAIDIISNDLGEMILKLRNSNNYKEIYFDETMFPTDLIVEYLERGHITIIPHEIEKAHVSEIAKLYFEKAINNPTFIIIPTFNCNYKCTYCFESKLHGSSDNYTDSIMSEEQVDNIFSCIDALLSKSNIDTTAIDNAQIILFGGEPLNKSNIKIIENIVNNGINRNISFVAVSNGHDLNNFLHLLGPKQISQIQITLDGPKEVHDRRRVSLDKTSSFLKIMNNIDDALNVDGVLLHLRIHIDDDNLCYFDDIIKLLESRNWTNNNRLLIYFSTTYSKSKHNKIEHRLRPGYLLEEKSHIFKQYTNVYASPIDYYIHQSLRSVFEQGARFPIKGTYCSANTGNYIFAPDWNIYACWESVGTEASKIGKYNKCGNLILDEINANKWFKRSVNTLSNCLDCPVIFACGGGCAQYAQYTNNSNYFGYCDDFLRTFKTVLARSSEYFVNQINTL